eukprot:Rhum_TRINITY_DN14832_c18_g1::Rhum_TRINITY_DN14832_c18_g1_i1::g.124881::m.124881
MEWGEGGGVTLFAAHGSGTPQTVRWWGNGEGVGCATQSTSGGVSKVAQCKGMLGRLGPFRKQPFTRRHVVQNSRQGRNRKDGCGAPSRCLLLVPGHHSSTELVPLVLLHVGVDGQIKLRQQLCTRGVQVQRDLQRALRQCVRRVLAPPQPVDAARRVQLPVEQLQPVVLQLARLQRHSADEERAAVVGVLRTCRACCDIDGHLELLKRELQHACNGLARRGDERTRVQQQPEVDLERVVLGGVGSAQCGEVLAAAGEVGKPLAGRDAGRHDVHTPLGRHAALAQCAHDVAHRVRRLVLALAHPEHVLQLLLHDLVQLRRLSNLTLQRLHNRIRALSSTRRSCQLRVQRSGVDFNKLVLPRCNVRQKTLCPLRDKRALLLRRARFGRPALLCVVVVVVA